MMIIIVEILLGFNSPFWQSPALKRLVEEEEEEEAVHIPLLVERYIYASSPVHCLPLPSLLDWLGCSIP